MATLPFPTLLSSTLPPFTLQPTAPPPQAIANPFPIPYHRQRGTSAILRNPMPRIAKHQADATSPASSDCQYCHMPPAKWAVLSCIWREGELPVRGIPTSGISDFDSLNARLLELRQEMKTALPAPPQGEDYDGA